MPPRWSRPRSLWLSPITSPGRRAGNCDPAGENEVFYEYRVNGQLMEIKVVPNVGPEYYLVPSGGGWIQDTESDLLIPSWVIFRW